MEHEASEKLGIGFPTNFPLRAITRWAIGEEAEQQHRRQRTSAAFALITAKLEDAATMAVEGQGRPPIDRLRACAEQITKIAGEVATIAAAPLSIGEG